MTEPPQPDPVRKRHRDLEEIALIALRCARMLMQSGSPGRVIHECGALVAASQGLELLGLRVGYASIAITLGHAANSITRMVAVAGHGVNHGSTRRCGRWGASAPASPFR